MTYLKSIELLRRVSRQLLAGKRELPPMSQLKSMLSALKYVQAEANVLKLDLLLESIENLQRAMEALQMEAQTEWKTAVIQTLTLKAQRYENNEEQRWVDCQTLAKKIHGLDQEKFDGFVKMKDKTRLIRLITNTNTIKSLTPVMVQQLSVFLNTSIDHLVDLAYAHYTNHKFEDTPEIVSTMRFVVARKKGLTSYI